MNEEQYSRANKRVLLAIVVVFGYIAATLMLALVVSQGRTCVKDYDGGSHGSCSYRYLGCSISW